MEVIPVFSAVINFTNSKPFETCSDHDFRLIYEKSISLLRYHEYIYHIVIKKDGNNIYHIRKSLLTGKITVNRVSDNKRIFY